MKSSHAKTNRIPASLRRLVSKELRTNDRVDMGSESAIDIADSFTKVVPPLTLEGHFLSITGMEIVYSV